MKALIGETKIKKLALLRATQARHLEQADVGVGFAEGVIRQANQYFTSAWCAVVTDNSISFFANGFRTILPDHLANKCASGLLLEREIEDFIMERFDKPFEVLVNTALLKLQKFLNNQ